MCRPEKGDAGEIFAALYMLFCGDILRKQENELMERFSVSLQDWFRLLKNGGSKEELTNTKPVKASVSLDMARPPKQVNHHQIL